MTYPLELDIRVLDCEPAGPHDLAFKHKNFESTRVRAEDLGDIGTASAHRDSGLCDRVRVCKVNSMRMTDPRTDRRSSGTSSSLVARSCLRIRNFAQPSLP